MNRGVNSSRLTKDYILSKVSQVTIFSTYLNLSNVIINDCIESGNLILSPLRVDRHPTAGFKYDNRGKLKFRDFNGYFWGDCFDVVAYIMNEMYDTNISISNKNDFIKVLRHITFTFKDIFYGKEKDIYLIQEINATVNIIKNKKHNISLVVRDWNEDDKLIWYRFGIKIKHLNINFIYPIEQYYINININPEPKYYYNKLDPVYAYYQGNDRNNIDSIKLYFPKRNKGLTKFISNYDHLEGIHNLSNNNDIIIVTKSTKDRVAMYSAIDKFLYGVDIRIGLINIPHETYKLRQNEYDWILSNLKDNGIIVSLMDNDRVGKIHSKWLKTNYNITPFLIPKIYNSKDFSELIENTNDDDVIIDLINNFLTHIKTISNVQNIRTICKSSWHKK